MPARSGQSLALPGGPTLALLAALLLVTLAHVPELFKAPVVDQADFELVAREILAGKALYRDIFDIKPPLIYWIYIVLRIAAGPGHLPVVFADLALRLATMVLVWRALRRRAPAGTLALGFILWGALDSVALFSGENNLLQTETVLNLLAALTLALTLGSTEPRAGHLARDLAMGVLAGLAALAKGPAALILVGIVWTATALTERRQALLRTLLAATAIVMVWLLHLAWAGLLSPMLQCMRFAAVYREIGPTSPVEAAAPFAPYLLLAGALAVWGAIADGRSTEGRSLTAWAALGIAMVFVQGKYFGYHLLIFFPPLALLAGVGLEDAAGRAGRAGKVLVIPAVLLWHLLLALHSHVEPDARGLLHLCGRTDLPSFDQTEAVTWWMSADAVGEIAQAVARRTAPGDPIFVFGVMPQVYLWAQRPMFGPYFFHYYLLAETPLSSAYGDLKARQAEFMDAFRRSPPRVVVVPDTQGVFEPGRDLPTFAALFDTLAADYTLTRIGSVSLFTRNR